LGHLRALETVPLLVTLAQDPSEEVRQSLAEALGALGSAATPPAHTKRGVRRAPGSRGQGIAWLFRRKKEPPAPLPDPVDLAVTTLEVALADSSAAVRTQAALALGR